MTFGERLRTLRNEKDLTLRELGKELNISFSALGKYERDEHEPDFDTLEKIASYFGVMIDWLIGRTDIKTFDEYVYITDVRHLEEKLQNIDPQVRKQIVNVIDSTYLILNRHIKDDNDMYLSKLSEIHRLINYFDMGCRRDNMNKINSNDSFADWLKFNTFYQTEICKLLDDMLELKMEHEKTKKHDFS